MTPQRIVIDGYDGSIPEDTSVDPVRERTHADLAARFGPGWGTRWEAGDREVRDYAVERFQYHSFMPEIVRRHNEAVPAAQQYAALDLLAGRGWAEVDTLYGDLDKSTTVNWLAAHHRFVKTAVSLRDILTRRVAAARALAEGKFGREMKDLGKVIYEEAVPAEQRITIPDVDAAELALTEFVETTRERIDMLRATVTGGYPEGFAPVPEPDPVPAPAEPVEHAWDDWPASHAVVAGREQRW